MVTSEDLEAGAPDRERSPGPVVETVDVWRSFKDRPALQGVSLGVAPGEIRALLGPNGAGKTTLIRVLCGVVDPDRGLVLLRGRNRDDLHRGSTAKMIGFAPSTDRSFYMRISGFENLLFFARLYGLRRREAVQRAVERLEGVGLSDAAKLRVNAYSAGMLKRLAVARALLLEPPLLLLDEATHDLDPVGTRTVQELITRERDRGAAVLWTTQRLDEIRDFADTVTVIDHGVVRFSGSVPELLARSFTRSYLVQVDAGNIRVDDLTAKMTTALGELGRISPERGSGDGHYALWLADGIPLGQALRRIMDAGAEVLSCRERRSQVEQAFLSLTGGSE
jgi:ABC-type multidrug transport system ATPase subunit